MTKSKIEEIVKYWFKTSKHDFDTMMALFRSKRYSDCLFFGHLALEKILKALVVKKIKKHAPYVHDLVRLSEIAKLDLTEEELDLLDRVNDFNIRSRYPEYKLDFYKKCTKRFTQKYLDEIIILHKKLCRQLKRKK